MTTKAQGRICARCGAALKHYALRRLCPSCLLQGGLHESGLGAASGAAPVARASPPSPVASLPEAFGDYELLEMIARGGMGVVYKARQKSLNRIVAVKMLLLGQFAEPKFVQRFRAEAEAVAQLQHPNIVAIHEIGECNGQPFFSMDYVEGKNLAQMSADFGSRGVDFRRCAHWVKTIAEAVQYAHERGIIHRDLKPSNVLIDSIDRPRITDFGLAKRLTGDSDLTLTGQVLGSPNYLPPEQADPKRGTVGVASDVYALGAILYHLITGRPPFQADSLTTLLRQVVETEPAASRSLNPSIPRDLETICLKCLEKDAPRRYLTAQELVNDLNRFLAGEPIAAQPVGAVGQTWKWCRRRPALAGLTTALVLTLLAGATAVWLQLRRTQASELVARQNAYAADMNMAQVAAENGDLGAAMSLLKAHSPAPGQRDLRGWEWRYLWQRCRSDELFELTRSTTGIDGVSFSPDGKFLAVHDQQATLTLWDLSARRPACSFKTQGYFDPFVFSKTGNLLAYYASGETAVNVVSLESRQEIARLPHGVHVSKIAFSADGMRLFTCCENGTLFEWDTASKSPRRSLQFPWPAFTDGPNVVAFSSDGGLMAYRLEHGVGICELDSGKETKLRISGTNSSPTALTFSADGKLLAAGIGGSGSEAYLWAVEDLWTNVGAMPSPRHRFGKHRDWITALAFSPDSRALVSGSADSTLRVWELNSNGASRRYQGHRHQVLSVAWAPNSKSIVSGGGDGSVRVWDPWHEPKTSEPAVVPVRPYCWQFCLSADGKSAVVLEWINATNQVAVVWDTVNMGRTEALEYAGTNLARLAWAEKRNLLATGDDNGNVTVWNLISRRSIARYEVPRYRVGSLEFFSDGRFLWCGAVHLDPPWDRTGRLWDLFEGREIPLPPEALAGAVWAHFSPDGRTMVALHYGGALDLWDLSSGRCVRRVSQPLGGPNQEEGYVAFSPDGGTWASSAQRGALALWDTRGKGRPVVVPRTTQELWDLSFSPDGTRLLVSGRRSADIVRLLDVASHRFVATLSGKPDVYWFSRISGDQNTLYAVGVETVLLWRAPSWAEIEAAEKGESTP